jgi:enoyl-CoA hydratase/carnithine racemase
VSNKKTDIIIFKVENNIGHIILNSPPSNMMDYEWSITMEAILPKIDPVSLKGILVYGAKRHFSAGAVLDSVKQSSLDDLEKFDDKSCFPMSKDCKSFKTISEFTVPVVAAIRGVCLGSGFELALACHWRICDDQAIMGSVESSFNLLPGCGGTFMLPDIVGTSKAVELILKGNTINSHEALKLKIVNEVVHHNDLIPLGIEYINRLYPFYQARYKV